MSDPTESDEDLGFALPKPAAPSRTRVIAIAVLAAALVGGAFVIGYLPRRRDKAQLDDSTAAAAAATPKLEVIAPKAVSSDRALQLPGSVQPLEETVLYARATGYVTRWNVDLGDKVTEGQVLVEIATPDLDRELDQARAQLGQAQAAVAQAEAARDLSKATLGRYQKLVTGGYVSSQDVEQKQAQSKVDEANLQVAKANVQAHEADVRRLSQLKSFAKVTAPFAGTITSRTVERGALVTEGASPLYKVTSIDTARVIVQVPQDVASAVHVGVTAQVTVREFAGRTFDGQVAHAAGALDAQTRTMPTEVRVPNPKGELLAGMYAQVALTLPSPHRVFEIPATALYNDAMGLRVAVIDQNGANGTLRFVTVGIERDTGAAVLIATGLDGSEKVVRLANASLVEGMAVEATAAADSPR